MPTSRRIWFRRGLLVIGALLCFGIPAYIELCLKRPVGAGPSGPPVPPDAFAVPWTERPVLLLGIGDSITRGLGAKSVEHSFFQRLLVNPEDEWEDMRGRCLAGCFSTPSSVKALCGRSSNASRPRPSRRFRLEPRSQQLRHVHAPIAR